MSNGGDVCVVFGAEENGDVIFIGRQLKQANLAGLSQSIELRFHSRSVRHQCIDLRLQHHRGIFENRTFFGEQFEGEVGICRHIWGIHRCPAPHPTTVISFCRLVSCYSAPSFGVSIEIRSRASARGRRSTRVRISTFDDLSVSCCCAARLGIHYIGDESTTAQYLLVFDAINFCFWPGAHSARPIEGCLSRNISLYRFGIGVLPPVNGITGENAIGMHSVHMVSLIRKRSRPIPMASTQRD